MKLQFNSSNRSHLGMFSKIPSSLADNCQKYLRTLKRMTSQMVQYVWPLRTSIYIRPYIYIYTSLGVKGLKLKKIECFVNKIDLPWCCVVFFVVCSSC